MPRPASYLLLAGIVCLLAAVAATAQVPPPDEAWQTLETEHFRVTFPEHLEALGRRAADLAERAHRKLSAQFLEGPSGPIDVILTDHIDVSNGSALYWPSNRITLYARPPVDHLALAYFDDWLEQLVTHELAHVFHLDHAGAFGKIFRALVGRAPAVVVFPGAMVPSWVIEGLATWYESALTDAGRVHGTFHEMVLRTAALEGRFETIGQAGGNSPEWPGVGRRYVYGSLFFEHLLKKYGPDRMATLVEALAGQWVPYRLNRAGRRAFGVSLSSEWDAWTEETRALAEALESELDEFGPITEPETLTRDARQAVHPKVSPDSRSLVYVRADGRSDPRIVSMRPDGSASSTLTRTNHITTFDFLPSGQIVFAQLDFADRYRVFSDLYIVTPGGSVRRVTEEARLTAPSVGPDEAWAVAVVEGDGTNGLVRVDLRGGSIEELVPPEADTHWAYPAVSPDGRWIAATRWTEGLHDVVILDAHGRLVHEVTQDRALDLAPTWSASGRHLVWSSDRTGILNILASEVDQQNGTTSPPIMLTNMRTGATFPSVDPAGDWIYFSGYHVDGWEVERVPFEPGSAPLAPDPAARFDTVPAVDDMTAGTADAAAEALTSDLNGTVRGYTPLPTLRPTYWLPSLREPTATGPTTAGDVEVPRTELLGYAVGGRTSGFDLVGRHAYEVGLRIFTSGGKGEGDMSYEYRGLGNPTVGLTASQTWGHDGVRVRRPPAGEEGSPETFFVLERERRVAASMSLRRPRMRTPVAFTVSGGLVQSDRELLDDILQSTDRYQLTRPSSTLSEFTVSLSVSTARSHAFQMGKARGASMFVRARTRNDLNVPGTLAGRSAMDQSADDLIARFRSYVPLPGPGFAAPVLAVRADIGTARGPGTSTGYFHVGGASGSLPVRGYETSTRSGRHAWSASVEFRAPLALVNRGLGAWPFHIDRLFGSVLIDAGNVWGSSTPFSDVEYPRPLPLISAGFELSTDLLTFYQVPHRLRIGVAFPLAEGEGVRYYVRLGVPF